jgi:hypothetical protein
MIGKTMTAARQRRKWLRRTVSLLALALLAPVIGRSPIAATTQYVVVDRNTGLAILGFDPVAYFTDGAALAGKGEHEHRFAGAVWRFRNEGNRGAFAADPDVYMPRFGGYDPVGVARGTAVPGDPRVWVLTGQRLYLFYTPEARAAFLAAEEAIIAEAERNWATVQRTLSP